MRFERLYILGWSGHAQLHRLLVAAIKITGQIFTCHTQMHVHTQTHTHHTHLHITYTTRTAHTTSFAVKESAVYPPSHSEGKAPLARKMHTHWTGHILCVASNLGKSPSVPFHIHHTILYLCRSTVGPHMRLLTISLCTHLSTSYILPTDASIAHTRLTNLQ